MGQWLKRSIALSEYLNHKRKISYSNRITEYIIQDQIPEKNGETSIIRFSDFYVISSSITELSGEMVITQVCFVN